MFKLLDYNGNTYLSMEPGGLGGHRGLKIFGRLDCPSALSFIAKGQYVKHRVFFRDLATAIAAGYRPCAKCMPETYHLWRDKRALWDEMAAASRAECMTAKTERQSKGRTDATQRRAASRRRASA